MKTLSYDFIRKFIADNLERCMRDGIASFDDFLIHCGGWNCRHGFQPVPPELLAREQSRDKEDAEYYAQTTKRQAALEN